MDTLLYPSLACYLNPSIPVIGCTAVGIRSKTIEIPRAAATDEYKAIPILEIPMTLPPVRCFE